MIDDIFVSYECNGQYFPSYKDAWFYGKQCGIRKVRYVFMPTETIYNRVSELENAFKKYCQLRFGCDYFDINNKFGCTQLNLIGEL